MKSLGLPLVMLASALAAGTWIPLWLPAWARPDLFVIIAVYVALRASRRRAMGLCWLIGLVRDFSGGGRLGAHALAFLILAAAVGLLRTETEKRSPATCAPFVFAAVFFGEAFAAVLRGLSSGTWDGGVFGPAASAGLATSVASVPAAWFLNRVERWTGLRRWSPGMA